MYISLSIALCIDMLKRSPTLSIVRKIKTGVRVSMFLVKRAFRNPLFFCKQ